MAEAKSKKTVLYTLLSLLVVGGIALVILYTLNKPVQRNPNLYLIPEGYRGLVSIRYGIEAAPALPREGEFWVHSIPLNGVLETSSSPEYGFAADEYYFVNAQGKRTKIDQEEMIHGQGMGGKEDGQPVATFHVEPKAERADRKQGK